MSKKVKIFIIIFLVLIVVVFILSRYLKVKIVTDKLEYKENETPRLKIANNLLANLCFSSCYPYFFEYYKEGQWEGYSYQECKEKDIALDCVSFGRIKAFQLAVPLIKKGIHRIAVPVCKSCAPGDDFSEEARFYSNTFELK